MARDSILWLRKGNSALDISVFPARASVAGSGHSASLPSLRRTYSGSGSQLAQPSQAIHIRLLQWLDSVGAVNPANIG